MNRPRPSMAACEFHVHADSGDDGNPGTLQEPFRSIGAAARVAQPGDSILVHDGIYRETVSPPRGGTADRPITYAAAPGSQPIITGSDPVSGWTPEDGGLWRIDIPHELFGEANPFAEEISGDWINQDGRVAHTGSLYIDGVRLTEAPSLGAVHGADAYGTDAHGTWFAVVGEGFTRIVANVGDRDPRQVETEVAVRPTVFFPTENHIDHITVRGFVLQNAAPNWAPPTAHQLAIIGPNWAKGWVIEDNVIRNSSCAGISLGKFEDPEHDAPGGAGYQDWNTTIARARQRGWDRETVGHHIVRGNEITDCDEVGIVGAFGCAYSVIEDNRIHRIAMRGLFGGAEIAGIKFHGAVDTVIRDNWIHHCLRGIHLDWMTEGTQIVGNLMHDNDGTSTREVGFFEAGSGQDLFLEVNHGPCLVAGNLLLSRTSVLNAAHGTAFAHNLLRGVAPSVPRWLPRVTPWLAAHSTASAGESDNRCGDDRYVNNIFWAPGGLAIFDGLIELPTVMTGNVHTAGCLPAAQEQDAVTTSTATDPVVRIEDGAAYLRLHTEPGWLHEAQRRIVTTESLGVTATAGHPFVHPDGSDLRVDRDYAGASFGETPFPGPFAAAVSGEIRVWPKRIPAAAPVNS